VSGESGRRRPKQFVAVWLRARVFDRKHWTRPRASGLDDHGGKIVIRAAVVHDAFQRGRRLLCVFVFRKDSRHLFVGQMPVDAVAAQ